MAVSGHNGKNESHTGMSASIGLTLYDSNANEIKITKFSVRCFSNKDKIMFKIFGLF